MTDPASPAGESEAEAHRAIAHDLARAVPTAARGGLLVCMAAIAVGQVPPLLVNLFGGGLAISTQVRLGWLYTVASNAVAIELEQFGSPRGGIDVAATTTVRLALLTVTFVLAWLLLRAGAAAARHVRDEAGRRALAGAMVAPFYAVPLGLLGFIQLRLEVDGDGFLPALTSFGAVRWELFAFGFGLAAASGGIGGAAAEGGLPGKVGDAVAGGWRAFVWALGLALVGLMAYATIQQSGLEAYAGELRSLGPRPGAVVAGHQALTIPNHAVLTLVPAMGACDTVSFDGETTDVLCLDRRPEGRNPLEALSAAFGDQQVRTAPLPDWVKVFLVVPLISVVAGARRAASHARSRPSAALQGVASGAVFAVSVAIAVWASTITVQTTGGAGNTVLAFSLGASPVEAGLYALAWGVVVGAVAGWLAPSPASPR